jgi:MFS family permease
VSEAAIRTRPKIARSTHGLYYSSRLLGQVGQGVFFAFLVTVAGPLSDGAGGALGLGSAMVAMTAAAVAVGPLGGAVVDRLGARIALIVGAALRLAAIASGLLVLGAGEYAWAVAFLYSAASQVFSPAELTLVATVGWRRPAGTHASLFALQFGGQAAGGLLIGPLLYVTVGAAGMLAGAVVAYLGVVLVASLLGLRLRGVRGCGRRADRHEAQLGEALNFGRALRFFGREPRALYAVGMLAFFDVMIKSLVVTAPIFLKTELELGRTQLVMLVGTGIVGALVGLAWVARHRTTERAVETMRWALAAPLLAMFALAPVGVGLATLTVVGMSFDFGSSNTLLLVGSYAALPALFVLGLSLSVAPVIARSVLTATAPVAQQGRVFAAEAILSNVLVIPGLLAASMATDMISARATVIAIGVLGALVFAALEFAATKRWGGLRPLPDASRPIAVGSSTHS